MRCQNCGADTSNGLALCELCRRRATLDLEFLPVYFRNLTRWRPGRSGRSVPGSREPRRLSLASDDRVSRALDEAGTDLATWARCLSEDRGVELPQQGEEADTFAELCALLTEHLTSVATLDWAGAFVQSLIHHEDVLRGFTMQVAPGWYAGECRRCATPTHVVPGLTWVTCGGCGATTYARDHLPSVLNEARAWVARPKDVAAAIVAMVDGETSVDRLYDRIRKWESLGWLDSVRRRDSEGDPVGPKLYRFGDVLDRVSATRNPTVPR